VHKGGSPRKSFGMFLIDCGFLNKPSVSRFGFSLPEKLDSRSDIQPT
jgi:hypothetical protein